MLCNRSRLAQSVRGKLCRDALGACGASHPHPPASPCLPLAKCNFVGEMGWVCGGRAPGWVAVRLGAGRAVR